MPRIIISAYRDGENSVHNFEVPSDIPAGILSRVLARSMGWDNASGPALQRYRIESHPPGRPLNQRETLEQAGASDGASILFFPIVAQDHDASTENLDTAALEQLMAQSPVPTVRPVVKPEASVPTPSGVIPVKENLVSGWQPLGVTTPEKKEQPDSAPVAPAAPAQDGYVWKQLD